MDELDSDEDSDEEDSFADSVSFFVFGGSFGEVISGVVEEAMLSVAAAFSPSSLPPSELMIHHSNSTTTTSSANAATRRRTYTSLGNCFSRLSSLTPADTTGQAQPNHGATPH